MKKVVKRFLSPSQGALTALDEQIDKFKLLNESYANENSAWLEKHGDESKICTK